MSMGVGRSAFSDEPFVVDDLPEPIRAYRYWRVPRKKENLYDPDAPARLLSTNFRYEWPTTPEGGAVAECYCVEMPLFAGMVPGVALNAVTRVAHALHPSELHPPPGPHKQPNDTVWPMGFGCGIYALNGLQKPANWGGNVCGEVLLGGRVYTYSDGYRAEFATVVALYDWHLGSFRAEEDGTERTTLEVSEERSRDFLNRACELYDVPLLQHPTRVGKGEEEEDHG